MSYLCGNNYYSISIFIKTWFTRLTIHFVFDQFFNQSHLSIMHTITTNISKIRCSEIRQIIFRKENYDVLFHFYCKLLYINYLQINNPFSPRQIPKKVYIIKGKKLWKNYPYFARSWPSSSNPPSPARRVNLLLNPKLLQTLV